MTDILTAEDEKYLAQHEHSGMTREDVLMLKLLEAKLEREGREQGQRNGWELGLKLGRLEERIAFIEGMLERGGSWETIEALTGTDETGLHQLREVLDRLQGNHGSDVEMDRS